MKDKMNRRAIEKVLNMYWQSGGEFKKELIHIDDEKDLINDLFNLINKQDER
jgi:hypothetical protein